MPSGSFPSQPKKSRRASEAKHLVSFSIADRLLQLGHGLVDAEAGGELARGICLEGIEEFHRRGLGGVNDEGLGEEPVVVGIRRDVSAFEWVGMQVEELGQP
jgi:hypothetical protein